MCGSLCVYLAWQAVLPGLEACVRRMFAHRYAEDTRASVIATILQVIKLKQAQA